MYDGFEVQRRVTPAGGPAGDWEDFDYGSEWQREIGLRMILGPSAPAVEPEPGYLPYFLRTDQKLVSPLPQFADGLARYPDITLPAYVEAVGKLKVSDHPVPRSSALAEQFQIKPGAAPFDMFRPAGPAGPVGPAGGPGGAFVPQGQPLPPRRPGGPLPRGGPAAAPAAAPVPEGDFTLLRFLDPTVRPGEGYEYRVRLMLRNPNYGRDVLVRQPSDARTEVLVGDWVPVPGKFAVPAESFLYAFDPDKYLDRAREFLGEVGTDGRSQLIMRRLMETRDVEDGRRTVVQVQTWMERVAATGGAQEPVGAWVVAEMPVAPGEYIGKRQLIKLPLWSAAAVGYVLRELVGGVRITGLSTDRQPRGWPVSFRRPDLLVDFDGGRVRAPLATGREIVDETGTELLILGPDGKLSVKSSMADMASPDRAARDQTWADWLKRVKDRRDAPPGGPGDGPSNNSGFGRNKPPQPQ